MKQGLHILSVEDNESDFELIKSSLIMQGISFDIARVETREDFVQAINKGAFDVILSDYSLPCFDGFSALEIARETMPEVPFIFVSGVIGEDFALETLKRGARDYVLKGCLSRLGPAIDRALTELEGRPP